MVARDYATGRVTEPTPRKKNPDYKNSKDADPSIPEFIPDEPHIGIRVNADAPPRVVQTGYVRGGTTNPPEGDDGSVERVAFTKVEGDPDHGAGTVTTAEDKDGRTKVNPDDDSLPNDKAKAPKS